MFSEVKMFEIENKACPVRYVRQITICPPDPRTEQLAYEQRLADRIYETYIRGGNSPKEASRFTYEDVKKEMKKK